MQRYRADVIVVGAGLAGLVAAVEAADRGRNVLLLDQEGPQSLGGQAFWSLGGLFMVDTPEQRRMKICDSRDLAAQDWYGSAGFDRAEDANPRAVADAYLDFAAGEMRDWLSGLGMRWFPVVGWAERGGALAHGHGNSVPRFHLTWGTGPGVIAPFVARAEALAKSGALTFGFRHRVTELDLKARRVAGQVLVESDAPRGVSTSREAIGAFEAEGQA
ncbi:MAG: FAD-binding protein, partial [Pseudomonadota bacterium]|nr:FAD-binding protein [Pseudomonadota bacterium]